eukprot:3032189-Rhodomonas_salina.2
MTRITGIMILVFAAARDLSPQLPSHWQVRVSLSPSHRRSLADSLALSTGSHRDCGDSEPQAQAE